MYVCIDEYGLYVYMCRMTVWGSLSWLRYSTQGNLYTCVAINCTFHMYMYLRNYYMYNTLTVYCTYNYAIYTCIKCALYNYKNNSCILLFYNTDSITKFTG